MAKVPMDLEALILVLLIIVLVPAEAEVEDQMDKLVTVTVAVLPTEMLPAAFMVEVLGVMTMVTALLIVITQLKAVVELFVLYGLEIHVHSHQLV
jgi:hypothetical protein